MRTQPEQPLWTPAPQRVLTTHLYAFAREVERTGRAKVLRGSAAVDYAALHAWSVSHPEQFWPLVWCYTKVIASERLGREPWDDVVRGFDRMAPPDPVLGPRWFLGARLNFAENLLRRDDSDEAVVSWNERGRRESVTFSELRAAVAAVAEALRREGVVSGDRIAGYLPNVIETVVAMLAATSVGAIWSSCSPDFGVRGVLDRFGQIEPKVLFATDGYFYNGRDIDVLPRVHEIASRLEGLRRVVLVPYLRRKSAIEWGSAVPWSEWVGGDGPVAKAPEFARFEFDHPLYVLYSSGTTGLPKCMVHGAGGTLIQHLKEHQLQCDVHAGDRVFYYTTCGWMMWNWLVSALASGATIVLYDGSPFWPRPDFLWEIAARERLTHFGTSARYLAAAEKAGVEPRECYDLDALRAVLSTGSPLAPAGFEYVYRAIKEDVCLSSISGGTDIVSCFVGGNPTGPVWRGEIQAPGLGMAVEVFDERGRPRREGPGELVCTRPFPSMPVRFWNDPDGSLYRNAYFVRFPGVWRHGDWAEWTPHGGMVISGRSDATLNPGGVRIGTAEIYRVVDGLPEVLESVVIGQEVGDERGRDVRIVLFVRLREGLLLDDRLRERIRREIRENTSPHHVPKVIVQVRDIPRTISGKISEVAVREVVHGRPVKNVEALANPEALELFRDLPELAI
jgi:acetoacetyl-CoA synthetase